MPEVTLNQLADLRHKRIHTECDLDYPAKRCPLCAQHMKFYVTDDGEALCDEYATSREAEAFAAGYVLGRGTPNGDVEIVYFVEDESGATSPSRSELYA